MTMNSSLRLHILQTGSQGPVGAAGPTGSGSDPALVYRFFTDFDIEDPTTAKPIGFAEYNDGGSFFFDAFGDGSLTPGAPDIYQGVITLRGEDGSADLALSSFSHITLSQTNAVDLKIRVKLSHPTGMDGDIGIGIGDDFTPNSGPGLRFNINTSVDNLWRLQWNNDDDPPLIIADSADPSSNFQWLRAVINEGWTLMTFMKSSDGVAWTTVGTAANPVPFSGQNSFRVGASFDQTGFVSSGQRHVFVDLIDFQYSLARTA